MIRIFVSKLTPEGIPVSGEISAEVLGLESDNNIISVDSVSYDLVAQLVNNGVLVVGKVVAVMTCRCGKCMENYTYKHINSEICHFYEKPNKNEIDLTDDIREDILIGLPQKFVCSESCKGLCFHCGQNLNIKKCSCNTESEQENIWEKLDQLKI